LSEWLVAKKKLESENLKKKRAKAWSRTAMIVHRHPANLDGLVGLRWWEPEEFRSWSLEVPKEAQQGELTYNAPTKRPRPVKTQSDL
jgi:hypothetical protein